jgi:hypothetical protein
MLNDRLDVLLHNRLVQHSLVQLPLHHFIMNTYCKNNYTKSTHLHRLLQVPLAEEYKRTTDAWEAADVQPHENQCTRGLQNPNRPLIRHIAKPSFNTDARQKMEFAISYNPERHLPKLPFVLVCLMPITLAICRRRHLNFFVHRLPSYRLQATIPTQAFFSMYFE